MPAGRPPKPVEQKRRAGNPGGRALPASTGLAVVPVDRAPVDFRPDEVFDQILGNGVGWLGATDGLALALLRETLEERAEVRELMGKGLAGLEAHRIMRDLDKQIASQLAQLGFDPAARSRLGLAEVKAMSKMEALRAQQRGSGA